MHCRTNIMSPNTGEIGRRLLAIGSIVGLLAALFSWAVAIGTIQNAQAQSQSGQTLPLIQNFDNDDCGVSEGWQVVSVDSDVANTWSCSTEFSNADVNGFRDDVAANEWLITPALDMDAQTDETLDFRNWTRYTDANYPQLVVRYSTNYDGGGNPSTAMWFPIGGITFSPVDSQDWLDSGAIDLSAISGSNVYFAFHYTSTGTGTGSAANWRIDDIVFGTATRPTSLPTSSTPAFTATPTVAATPTSTATPASTATATLTPISTSTSTATPTVTSTSTFTPTSTLIPTSFSTTVPTTVPRSFPLSQGFDDDVCGATDGWQVVSVDTDVAHTWSCAAQFSNADVNGFGDDVAADEWLISPLLNMNAQNGETLDFRSYTKYTDGNYPQLEVLFSTTYLGGDPTTATWLPLSDLILSPENSETWTDSGTIDLSGIDGSRVHFAFHYTSTGTAAGAAANWRIDEIVFGIADSSTPMPTETPDPPTPSDMLTPDDTSTPSDTSTPADTPTPMPTSSGADTVKIHAVQGTEAVAALDGQVVRVEAIVVGDFQQDNQLSGFFIQEEDADADGDPTSSEGLFVYCDSCPADVAVGDKVQVNGLVGENFEMSQIRATNAGDISIVSNDNVLPSPAEISLATNLGSTESADTFEFAEGMLVRFTDELYVSEYFELARYGQLVLTANERPRQFTDQSEPDVVGYATYLAALNAKRIILDDASSKQNVPTTGDVDTPYFWPRGTGDPKGLSISNFVRGGDSIRNVAGALEWAFGAWRIRPVDEAFTYDFTSNNPRPDSAMTCNAGDLSIASFNVLNFFTTLGSRGANSTTELDRQREKIAAAICAIDADIFGLIEIENNGSTALNDLLNGVNSVNAQCGTYDFIDAGTIGSDAIAVAFIYERSTVSPVGDPAILDSSVDSRFIDTKNRPALAQTFNDANGDLFTAVVNHLKSKGSDCDALGDPDMNDGAANCNQTRANAAAAMTDWLATDPTGSGDPDFLIMGDLNAYRNETPIDNILAGADDVLSTDDDYIDLLDRFDGAAAYTYLFDGQRGYLDYMLANQTLGIQVRDATAWHINADEVPLFDYNDGIQDAGEEAFRRESTALPIYEPNAFRSSDHDPVLACLDLDYVPSAFLHLPLLFAPE